MTAIGWISLRGLDKKYKLFENNYYHKFIILPKLINKNWVLKYFLSFFSYKNEFKQKID